MVFTQLQKFYHEYKVSYSHADQFTQQLFIDAPIISALADVGV